MAKVMVVEDNEFFRDMLAETLKSSGHEIVIANDGDEALALMANQVIKVLITDIIMPKITGLSLIKEVREKYPNIQIIAISGGWRGGLSDYLKTTKEQGAAYAFAKPIDMDELLNAVNELAEK